MSRTRVPAGSSPLVAAAPSPRTWYRHARTILEIADCGQRINLEFYLHNELQVQNLLHKVDALLQALTEFRVGLAEEAQLYASRKASWVKRPAQSKRKRRRSRSA